MSRRSLEFAILGFGAVFLLYLAFSFRSGRRPARGPAQGEPLPTVPAGEEAGEATTVLKGFDYAETLRGKPLFRIHSERTVGFGPAAGLVPNVYVLEKVTLVVYPDQGEAVTVHSDRAQYDQRTKQARLSGNVVWTDQRGALGETDRLEFDPSARLLEAPGAVALTRGAFRLEARSGHYDLAKREMILQGPVHGTGTGEDSGGLTSLSADGADYRRDQSLIELSGHVSAAGRDGDTLHCDDLVFKVEPEGSRLQWGRAQGSVQGTLVSAPSGLASKSAQRGPRRYSASSAALLFGPDGLAQNLSLSGSPAQVADSRGTIDAENIEVSFQSGRAISAAARGHVRVDSDKNHADSERASLTFNASGEIESLELSEHVRMRGEDRLARADKAVDLPERGTWILTSDPGSATVESAGSRVSARRIDVDEKRHLLTADNGARAVFVPGEPGKAGGSSRKAPALVGDPDKPTYGKAQRLVLDDAAHVATLSGSATLWQDASSLSGDAITLNDVERSAVAVGNTRTVFLSASGSVKTTPKPSGHDAQQAATPTVVTAHRVTYQEKESKAVFEGGVAMTQKQRRATAEKATAILGSDRKLQQIDLEGDVSLESPAEGRSGRAEHATDWPREGKTVLEGSPAWVLDSDGNRVTGAVLTITDRGRRVEVTAPSGGKTETIHRTKSS